MATTSWPTRSRRESPSRAKAGVSPSEAQDGEIGVGIVADQVRREAAPIGKSRLDLARAADDVAVGQHIGVGVKTTPEPAPPARVA